jgi:hypothetical protein
MSNDGPSPTPAPPGGAAQAEYGKPFSVKTGSAQRIAYADRKATWEKLQVREGEPILMTVEPVDLPAGTKARFKVIEHDSRRQTDHVDWVEAKVEGRRLVGEWVARCAPDHTATAEGDTIAPVACRFEAALFGGEKVSSPADEGKRLEVTPVPFDIEVELDPDQPEKWNDKIKLKADDGSYEKEVELVKNGKPIPGRPDFRLIRFLRIPKGVTYTCTIDPGAEEGPPYPVFVSRKID